MLTYGDGFLQYLLSLQSLDEIRPNGDSPRRHHEYGVHFEKCREFITCVYAAYLSYLNMLDCAFNANTIAIVLCESDQRGSRIQSVHYVQITRKYIIYAANEARICRADTGMVTV